MCAPTTAIETRSSAAIGSAVGGGSLLVVLPSGSGTARCQRAPKASSARSACARADQGDAERQAVGPEAERQGQRR